ncbi:MAG: hypothetical protein AAF628_29285 [Planctomycetota bacterium]
MPVSVVAIVGLVIWIVPRLPGRPREIETAPATTAKPTVDITWKHPRVQQAVAWIEAIAAGDSFALTRHSDEPALQRHLGVAPESPLGSLRGEARNAVALKLQESLTAGEQTAVLRDFTPVDARLEAAAMASAQRGTVLVSAAPREGTPWHDDVKNGGRYYDGLEAKLRLSFRMEGDTVKVASFEVLHVPERPGAPVQRRARRQARTEGQKPEDRAKDRSGAHPEIQRPARVKREIDGETITVAEAELVPLEHLEETPSAQRAKIDRLIGEIVQLDQPAGLNKAIDALRDIGRPAIPRLLNQLYEFHAKGMVTEDHRIAARRVIQALLIMTGRRFGFNVADRTNATVDGNREQRESALKQWYAWWYRYHDRDYTEAIDKAEGEALFQTEDEQRDPGG